jgi:hypothetical protein
MGDSRSIAEDRTSHVSPHKMGRIGHIVSLGVGHIMSDRVGHCMSEPGDTHENNLPGS